MHEKILTIVIPTYNMEKLLPRCLDSLVTPQSSDSIEVLVVNDGSKDNSLNVAQEYEKNCTPSTFGDGSFATGHSPADSCQSYS